MHLYVWCRMWAPYWYNDVHKSTGFSPAFSSTAKSHPVLSPEDRDAYAEVLPLYQLLKRESIGECSCM